VHQAHGLQDFSQNLSNESMQIHPKYHLFRWELQCRRLKSRPSVLRNACPHNETEGAVSHIILNKRAVFELHT
jgi:hypothetical protein